jgi:hypothetical protein
LAQELVWVLVGVAEAREGRKEREVQDKKRRVDISEWKGSGRSGRSGMSKKMERRASASSQGRNMPSPSYNNTENRAGQKTKTKKGMIIKRQSKKPPT